MEIALIGFYGLSKASIGTRFHKVGTTCSAVHRLYVHTVQRKWGSKGKSENGDIMATYAWKWWSLFIGLPIRIKNVHTERNCFREFLCTRVQRRVLGLNWPRPHWAKGICLRKYPIHKSSGASTQMQVLVDSCTFHNSLLASCLWM